jgi:hypothetical protein
MDFKDELSRDCPSNKLKEEILRLMDEHRVLMRFIRLVGDAAGRLGMIQRLDFRGFILLRPEVLSRYAAAVVRKVPNHPQELGCIREDELLAGDLDYQDFKRLPREDEAVVLRQGL